MIESVTVENFRCYERLRLTGLRRVNVIVGKNGSGKTALLESLFLAATGHPQIPLRFRVYRNMGEPVISLERAGFEALWKDLFFRFDDRRVISLSISGSPENTRSARIYYSSAEEEMMIPLGKKPEDSTAIVPLRFEYHDASNETTEFVVSLGQEGLSIKGAAPTMEMSYYPSSMKANPQEAAKRFSELSKTRRAGRVGDTLSRIYEFVEDLSIEVSGQSPFLYASVRGMPEKMKVSLVSEGVFRLMSYLLGIASQPKGVILIDEIENGFYYETFPKVWHALFEFCTEYDTQLFVSSHSLECLTAIADFAKGREDHFALLRTVRENGNYAVRQITGEGFRDAIDAGLDIR